MVFDVKMYLVDLIEYIVFCDDRSSVLNYALADRGCSTPTFSTSTRNNIHITLLAHISRDERECLAPIKFCLLHKFMYCTVLYIPVQYLGYCGSIGNLSETRN